jgi:uncharacterized protein (DUF1800 family)
MVTQNEFYRSHATDTFPNILRGVTKDRAMMVYLDVDGSNRRAPNENYARELMELFSLGIGNYTETDVREGARAFTGWRVPKTRIDQGTFTLDEPVFYAQLFDNGTKTFLGKTGNFKAEDVVDIIVDQPASASYLVRRLFAYFIFPEPTAGDIAPFVDVYQKNNRGTGAVVEAMLRSDVFYSPKAYRALVKSPVEYAVGAIKALGLQSTSGQLLQQAGLGRGGGYLTDMGQIPFEPPNVAGWPGGAHWLNSATIFARLNFLNVLTGGAALAQQPRRDGAPNGARQQPGRAVSPPTAAGLGTASQAIDYYLPLVLDDNVPDEARSVFTDYAGAQFSPEQQRGLAYLILGSPQFHLS